MVLVIAGHCCLHRRQTSAESGGGAPFQHALRRYLQGLESSIAKIMAHHSTVFEEGGRNQLLGEVQSRSGIAHDAPKRRHNRPMHQTRKNSKYQRRRAAGTSIASIVPMLSLLCLFAFVGRCSGFVTENLMGSAAPRSIHAKLSVTTSSNDEDAGISRVAEDEGSTSSIADDLTNSSDDVPSTPCVRICRYNANFYDGQICIGCYRDAYEISSWPSMTKKEKSWALLDAADRVPEGCDVIEGDESGDATDAGTGSCDFSAAISKDELLRQAKYWEKR